MTKLIGLTGVARSGKDTCANFIEEFENKKVLRLYFSKILKDACKLLFNLTDEQLYGDKKEETLTNWKLHGQDVSPRKLLQWLGTDILRNQVDMDFFKKHMIENITKGIEEKYDFILVTDVRFDNEAELITQLGGKIYHIERPNNQKINLSDHASEKGIKEELIHEKIINDSTLEDFKEKVNKLFN